MESIGEKLRTAREQQGTSIDQVARDTNIAKRFIMAMEAEDFSVFPGEPYLIGFLRSYAQYLGLEPAELVNLYRNIMIQEQPVPMEELLQPKRPILAWAGIGVLVLALLLAGGWFGYQYLTANAGAVAKAPEPPPREEPAAKGREFTFDQEVMEQRFQSGDRIAVTTANGANRFSLDVQEGNLLVTLSGGPVTVKQGEGSALDVDGDQNPDLKVFYRSFDEGHPEGDMVLRFDKVVQSPTAAGSSRLSDSPLDTAPSAGIGRTTEPSRVQQAIIVMEALQPTQFNIEAAFKSRALFRAVVDEDKREESMYSSGQVFRAQAQKEVFIGVANAAAVELTVAGKKVELGQPGQVVTRLVKWIRNEGTGSYALTLVPVY